MDAFLHKEVLAHIGSVNDLCGNPPPHLLSVAELRRNRPRGVPHRVPIQVLRSPVAIYL